jgi:predicted XRE-type DNA-binding protein
MITVLTGDIVHSSSYNNPAVWLDPLKKLLHKTGDTPKTWEFYRGDSFQVEVDTTDSLKLALQIKSIVKQVDGLDARIAIGIGQKSYQSSRISESTGSAFVRSGHLLDWLKTKNLTLAVKSHDPLFDQEMNMMLKLALIIINSWSTNSAETAEIMLENPDLPQKKISELLEIAQSSVSGRIHRGSLYEILELESYYRNRIQRLTHGI